MSQPSFFKTNKGWVNADVVAHVDCDEMKGGLIYSLYDREGEHLGLFEGRHGADLLDHIHTIIPAAAGQHAVVIDQDYTGERPVLEDYTVAQAPVVAWRIYDRAVFPVVAANNTPHRTPLIQLADGQLIQGGDYVYLYPNTGDAVAAALEGAQCAWDIAQAKKDAA